MDISVQPGTYVVAVSGGVDSMVLLDLIARQPGVRLVVAHYDHGIRHNSALDRQLVEQTAKRLGLPFVHYEGKLGPGTSEEAARKARYKFLHQVREASGAKAILTAHHHNDALETALLNLLRGTNRKGLTALRSHATVHRPLLHITKEELRQYANDQGLVWREDPSNTDTVFMRNYIRHKILPRLSKEAQDKLTEIIKNMRRVNEELDTQLLHFLHVQTKGGILDRHTFVRLPHAVAREVMAAWLRHHGVRDFDQKTLERLVVAAKTFHPGAVTDVVRGSKLRVQKRYLALEYPDR
jgi:tRNA(Ile)-lysidine synthetase-like protein